MRVLLQSVLRAAAFAGVFAGAGFAMADTARANGSTVLVNEVPVLTLRSGSVSAKAAGLAARLNRATEFDTVEVRRVGRGYRLFVSGKEVLNITKAEAKASMSNPRSLALAWASSLRRAAVLPPLQVDRTHIRTPIGTPHRVSLVGSLARKAAIEVADPSVASVQRVSGGFVIRPKALGSVSVTVSAGQATEAILLDVLPYAAQFPQHLSVTVSGAPATNETVRGAIETAVRRQLVVHPGSRVQVQSVDLKQIPPGEARSFAVRLSASAGDALPRQGVAHILVRNAGIAQRNEQTLWYCNEPENVKAPGGLFAAKLQRSAPARLLYHHINDSSMPLYLDVRVVNEHDVPAKLLLIPGDSEPDKNPVLAGLVAADMFVRNWIHYSGDVVVVPPHSSMPISVRRLGPQDTASGLATLRLLEGPDELLVRADAKAPSNVDWISAVGSSTPWRTVASLSNRPGETTPAATVHAYPDPYKHESVSYEVGGPFRFVRIGQRPIANEQGTKALQGNFGVIYNVKASLTNPTEIPADVEVVFEASAGYSGAIFVLNGEVKRTPLLQPKTESQIVRLRMEPGSSRVLSFMTLPLSGSSYPATVTIRPYERGTATRALFDLSRTK